VRYRKRFILIKSYADEGNEININNNNKNIIAEIKS